MKENIKEDIKLLEEMKKNCLFKRDYIDVKAERKAAAIENILSDYKRLQEEFKQVDHECERLEQKELRLEKENEELQKENEELKYKYDKALSDLVKVEKESKTFKSFTSAIFNDGIEKELIPVQKIKDKIEELKNKSGGNVFHIQQTINAEIRLLQDLLEEKGG